MSFESAIDLPRAWGDPLASARIKLSPIDFIVREVLAFDFDQSGEHLYLYIRKCGLNTNDVVEQLQRQFNCSSADIGVSGLKDKQAITDQWFSVRTSMSIQDAGLSAVLQTSELNTSESQEAGTDPKSILQEIKHSVAEGAFVVLEQQRHARKLRRGAHSYNRFTIALRDITASDLSIAQSQIDKRLELIAEQGFVNYFGPQRFGFGQLNLVKAERYFANPKKKITRTQRGLLLSAARGFLFNRVCAERVHSGSWNKPMLGEPLLLNGTQSFFINDETVFDADERYQAGDVHSSGPMWGAGQLASTGSCSQFESEILNHYAHFTDGLAKAGLKQQRRALRARVEQLQWFWQSPQHLTVDFRLLKGVYATSFISEFVTVL